MDIKEALLIKSWRELLTITACLGVLELVRYVGKPRTEEHRMSEHKIRNGKTWNTKSVMANPEHEIRKRDLRDHVIGIIKHGTPNPEG